MNKAIIAILIGSTLLVSDYGYNGSTTAVVTLAGGVIKSKQIDTIKKYKRKDCPVCKGKGWYISGDGIAKIDCGYCETEKSQPPVSEIIHPPAVLKPDCKTKVIKR